MSQEYQKKYKRHETTLENVLQEVVLQIIHSAIADWLTADTAEGSTDPARIMPAS